MPYIETGDIRTYYEARGQGRPLVLVHGAFVDSRMWDPQVRSFRDKYQVLRYDLRGHGKTKPSARERYTIELFADDLLSLLDALGIEKAAICGVSLGGMIAQAFAARHPERLSALILADTAVSVAFTLTDKLQRYLIAPPWLLLSTIRLLGTERWVRTAFRLAKLTRGEGWFGRHPETVEYVRGAMLRMPTDEYLKVYRAIYAFDLQDLSRVRAPTLVLNGEFESRSVFRHAEEIRRQIPHAETSVIAGAGHTSNLENPEAFDAAVGAFLERHL